METLGRDSAGEVPQTPPDLLQGLKQRRGADQLREVVVASTRSRALQMVCGRDKHPTQESKTVLSALETQQPLEECVSHRDREKEPPVWSQSLMKTVEGAKRRFLRLCLPISMTLGNSPLPHPRARRVDVAVEESRVLLAFSGVTRSG